MNPNNQNSCFRIPELAINPLGDRIVHAFFYESKKGEEEKAFEDLNTEEQEMIRGIFELSDTTVKEIMVPRIDVVFISKDMDKKEIIEKFL